MPIVAEPEQIADRRNSLLELTARISDLLEETVLDRMRQLSLEKDSNLTWLIVSGVVERRISNHPFNRARYGVLALTPRRDAFE